MTKRSKSRRMVAVLTDGAGLKAAQGVWHIASRDLAAPRGDLAEIDDDSRRPERATMKSFPTFKARTAVLLAVTAISLLWTAPAQALTIKGSSTDVMVHLNKPKKDVDLRIRSADGRSVVPLIDAGEQVAYVQVGSTGQGDSEEECNDRGNLINAWYALATAAVAHEDWGSFIDATGNAEEEHEAALDAGCFIVYKQGPPPEPEPEIG